MQLIKSVFNAGLATLIVSGLGATVSGQALAQDVQSLEKQIKRIEAKNAADIKALQAEIAAMRKGGKVVKGAPLVADEPKIMMKKNPYHFGFSDASGDNTVELTGRVHMDVGGYVGYNRQPGLASPSDLGYGLNFRRARIGVQGIFMGDWAYGLIYDFGGSQDNGSGGSTSGGLENAFITYNGLYKHGQPFPIAFDIGAIDVPWTLDEPNGSNDTMFMERSSAQVLATTYGGGDNRTAIGFRSNNEAYWLGVYLTGPTTGQLHTIGATTAATPNRIGPQLSLLARATYNLYQDKATNTTIHVGFNYANLFDPRSGNGPYTSSLTLSDRPELRIDNTTFLATGAIPASGGQVFGAEAAATYGNFYVQGEYYHYLVDTKVGMTATDTNFNNGRNGPTASFDGGYVQASYTFGGKRVYKPATGAYSGVIPDAPLAWGTDGWGALEVAGRYSIVDLRSGTLGILANSGAFGGGVTGASLSAVKQESYGVGLNWYPNGNMRFMLDYEHVVIDKNTYAAPLTKTGATIDWVGARSQFVF